MKLREIAEKLGCRLAGDGDVEIDGVAGLLEAGPRKLTFLSNPRYARHVKQTRAAAILIDREIPENSLPCLISENPYLDFARGGDSHRSRNSGEFPALPDFRKSLS